MAKETADLIALPERIAKLALEFHGAQALRARRYYGELMRDREAVGDFWMLRNGAVDWKLYLAKSEEKVVFFFFRTHSSVRVVLDTKLSFRLTVAPPDASIPPEQRKRMRYRLVVPPFVIPRPTVEQLNEYAPIPRTRDDRLIVFHVGPDHGDYLGFSTRGDDLRKTTLRYRPNTGDESEDPGDARAYLALVDAVSQWVSEDFEQGTEFDLGLPAKRKLSDVESVLVTIADVFRTTAADLASAPRDVPRIVSDLLPIYVPADFRAQVVLRLKENGDFASGDEDEPFQLLLRATISTSRDEDRMRIAVGPPDFLVSGPMHEAFASEFKEPSTYVEILEKIKDDDRPDQELFRKFVFRSVDSAIVFRTKRTSKYDVDMFIIRGTMHDKQRMLIGSAEFVIHPGSEPWVVMNSKSAKVHFFGDPDGKIPDFTERTRLYFLRLVDAIRRWTMWIR